MIVLEPLNGSWFGFKKYHWAVFDIWGIEENLWYSIRRNDDILANHTLI
jgi:hypothetical protein